jgi:hypothetical protein
MTSGRTHLESVTPQPRGMEHIAITPTPKWAKCVMAIVNQLRRQCALGCLLLTLGSFPPIVHAFDGDWTIEKLMALVAEQRKPSVAFEEATYSSVEGSRRPAVHPTGDAGKARHRSAS